MRTDEGYIKFILNWEEKKFDFPNQDFELINVYRTKLFDLNLIGAYADGIGFGNISIRIKKNNFVISGSATGNIKDLTQKHYALVTDFNIERNSVSCIGLSKASSESMSHGALYMANTMVNSVIHIHHKQMWNKYIDILPTTNKKAEFGTAKIAYEIQRLAEKDKGIIVMGGHPEGIITYGRNLEEAYQILFKYYNKI